MPSPPVDVIQCSWFVSRETGLAPPSFFQAFSKLFAPFSKLFPSFSKLFLVGFERFQWVKGTPSALFLISKLFDSLSLRHRPSRSRSGVEKRRRSSRFDRIFSLADILIYGKKNRVFRGWGLQWGEP
jgi:hypothetical protein